MDERSQFTFYRSFWEAVKGLPKKDRLPILESIMEYALDGKAPSGLSQSQSAFFLLVKPNLDASRKKAANGKQGGSKPKAKGKQTQREKEVEKENENEVEVEIENEIEKESLYTDGVCVNRDTDTDRFERFWNLYPNKLGKQKAWEAWKMEKPNLDKLVVALEWWKNSRQWLQDNGRFIPKAEKFIKEKYDLQVPDGAVPRGASGYLGKAELEAIERLMNGM